MEKYLGKIYYFSYDLKCCQPAGVGYYCITNFSGKNQLILQLFLHGVSHQGKVGSDTTTFSLVCPFVLLVHPDCMILLSSVSLGRYELYFRFSCMKLTIKGRQYLTVLLLIESAQLFFSSNQIAEFFDLQYLRKESNAITFSHGYVHDGKVASDILTWLCVASCASHPVRLQDFFIINISGKN